MGSDLLLLFAVLTGVLWGAWKGFTWHLGILLSILLGFSLGLPVAGAISESMGEDRVAVQILIFAGCYGAVSFACFLGANLFRKLLARARMETFDRHMGAFLGALHGWILGCLVLLLVLLVAPEIRPGVLERPSGRALTRTLDAVQETLPPSIRRVLEPLLPAEPSRGRKGDG